MSTFSKGTPFRNNKRGIYDNNGEREYSPVQPPSFPKKKQKVSPTIIPPKVANSQSHNLESLLFAEIEKIFGEYDCNFVQVERLKEALDEAIENFTNKWATKMRDNANYLIQTKIADIEKRNERYLKSVTNTSQWKQNRKQCLSCDQEFSIEKVDNVIKCGHLHCPTCILSSLVIVGKGIKMNCAKCKKQVDVQIKQEALQDETHSEEVDVEV